MLANGQSIQFGFTAFCMSAPAFAVWDGLLVSSTLVHADSDMKATAARTGIISVFIRYTYAHGPSNAMG